MSPEQAAGDPLDHRSDQFSLGVTFYEAVTGQLPFAGDSPLDTILKTRYEPAVPPHDRHPEVPRAVSEVILRMLAKDPAGRYPDYDALLADLDALTRPVTPPPADAVGRTSWARRLWPFRHAGT